YGEETTRGALGGEDLALNLPLRETTDGYRGPAVFERSRRVPGLILHPDVLRKRLGWTERRSSLPSSHRNRSSTDREKHAEPPHRPSVLIKLLSRILSQGLFIEDSVQETAAFRTSLKRLFALKEGAAIIA